MKRIQEKVKDLVDVRVYRSLQDFTTDPGQTLAAYHFTDATSEMMAKWLDALSHVQIQNGTARALAGYRGVGKSHFFATFGAIVANPDLRSRITDSHVASSAQQLKRRRYPVAFVRRGTHQTLLDEIKDAVASTFEMNPTLLSDNLAELARFSAEKAGDLPFVLMVDTAFERTSRVSRDDGALLGELAEITKNLNFFIAVALDDDIARADGVNAAIARNFTIDYLDQEHLYRVVETHIFPKHRQAQSVLHDIHQNFREVLPGFRWSQPRFISLYPVHPVILETAQFIRLYAPDFAFLGFASESGNKVMGRPANSLVGLDEVFDRVENSLRKAEDLSDAFAAYDRLGAEVVANVPVMQRLQAKLILKALLVLSLDGDGTTASEISAAMLIYDEVNPDTALQNIVTLLDSFVAAIPEQIRRKPIDGRETLYSFKISGKDSLNDAIAEAAQNVKPEVFDQIMRRFARDRFADWTAQTEDESVASVAGVADCHINWRGGGRRGRIVWNWAAAAGETPAAAAESVSEFVDWEVLISNDTENNSRPETNGSTQVPMVVWQTAALRQDEQDALRRYYVLLTDRELREAFGEQVRAAGHSYQKTVGNIWRRIFLEDAKIRIDGKAYAFTENAQSAPSLCELLSEMLTPLFESRYPQHPVFPHNLSINEVNTLIAGHFSGSKPTLPEIQELAQNFALPLGLVSLHGNQYILNSDEKNQPLPFAGEVLAMIGKRADDGETVSLRNVYRRLRREPFGLVHEAVHLVLAALVAQRQIEFVTSKGDRINRRSLDLQIIWDDIIGIAPPSTKLYSSQKLTWWARTLTGSTEDYKTIDSPQDRERILRGLETWLADWRASGVLERFEELPPEILTTQIWRLATQAQKTFGTVAATIETVMGDTIPLEEGLQRIADAFSDSEQEFFRSTKDLVTLEDFIGGARQREKIWQYLAVCETTEDDGLEALREKILQILAEMPFAPNEARNRELSAMWMEFQQKFSEYFSIKHYTVMKSHHLQEQFDEIMQSDEWWEFVNLSALPVFQKTHWREARELCRRLKELNCNFDVQELLKTYPFCACSFRLSQIEEWESLPQQLTEAVARGRKKYRKTLSILGETLQPLFEHFAGTEKNQEHAAAARHLAEIIAGSEQVPLFNHTELVVLRKAVQAMPASPLLQISIPSDKGFLSREELRLQVGEWLDELPSEPVLLKI